MITDSSCRSTSSGERGFTLVELGVVMIVSAIILVAVVQVYQTYLNDRRFNETFEKQSTITATVASFFGPNGRYPCPAQPNLPLTDPNAGVEIANCTAVFAALTPGTCDAATGICKVNGRDTQFDTDTDPDPVLIGAIPFTTLKTGAGTNANLNSVDSSDTLDPWGFKMTYAVTQSQTVTNDFRAAFGAIFVETETPGISLVRPAGSGQFIIISHGDNHMGAYNANGVISFPCATGMMESENCDRDDALFIGGLRSMAAGATYFDDVVTYQAYTLSQLWAFSPAGGNSIYSLNDGFVGIGKDDPEQKLDVEGNVRVQDNAQSGQICDQDGQDCWTPEKLGGTGMVCPSQAGDPANTFRAATGFALGAAICSGPIAMPSNLNNKKCTPAEIAAGKLMVGVSSTGNIICDIP